MFPSFQKIQLDRIRPFFVLLIPRSPSPPYPGPFVPPVVPDKGPEDLPDVDWMDEVFYLATYSTHIDAIFRSFFGAELAERRTKSTLCPFCPMWTKVGQVFSMIGLLLFFLDPFSSLKSVVSQCKTLAELRRHHFYIPTQFFVVSRDPGRFLPSPAVPFQFWSGCFYDRSVTQLSFLARTPPPPNAEIELCLVGPSSFVVSPSLRPQ